MNLVHEAVLMNGMWECREEGSVGLQGCPDDTISACNKQGVCSLLLPKGSSTYYQIWRLGGLTFGSSLGCDL